METELLVPNVELENIVHSQTVPSVVSVQQELIMMNKDKPVALLVAVDNIQTTQDPQVANSVRQDIINQILAKKIVYNAQPERTRMTRANRAATLVQLVIIQQQDRKNAQCASQELIVAKVLALVLHVQQEQILQFLPVQSVAIVRVEPMPTVAELFCAQSFQLVRILALAQPTIPFVLLDNISPTVEVPSVTLAQQELLATHLEP
jgi:hypothetical protein